MREYEQKRLVNHRLSVLDHAEEVERGLGIGKECRSSLPS